MEEMQGSARDTESSVLLGERDGHSSSVGEGTRVS